MKLKRIAIFISFVLIFSSCTTTKSLEKTEDDLLCPKQAVWKPIQEGFSKLEYIIDSLDVYCCLVKIDLSTPGLSVQVKPEQTNEYKNFTIAEFSRQFSTVVAMNTTSFDPELHPQGIIQIDGNIITPPVSRYSALLLQKDETGFCGKILSQNDLPPAEKGTWIVGGFFQILQGGQSKPFEKTRRSRTAVGLSEDGKTLILLIAVPSFSIDDQDGLNYEECAQILLQLGCFNAMAFDGGHSSAMAINSITQKQPLFPRQIPCAIGFSVQPLSIFEDD